MDFKNTPCLGHIYMMDSIFIVLNNLSDTLFYYFLKFTSLFSNLWRLTLSILTVL